MNKGLRPGRTAPVHLDAIQAARGISALLVLIHHAALKGEQLISSWASSFHMGAIGVDVFFIVSGFIIYHVTNHRFTPRREYLAKRLVRVFPMYWLLSLLALAIYLVHPEWVNSRASGGTNVLGSFLLVPDGAPFLVNNGWTLTYEVMFYLLWCVTAMPRPGVRRALFSSMALVAASLLAVTPLAAETHFQFSLLFEFALGILLAIAFEKGFLQPRPWLGIMMMLAGLLISSQLEMGFESDLRGFINALPAMAIFLGTLWLGSEWKKLPLFSHLGNSSYSLYLFHPFVLGVVPLLARWLSLHAILPLVTVIAASCIAAIVISHIVYLYVERPLTKRLRKAVL